MPVDIDQFSDDQIEAYNLIEDALDKAGVDLKNAKTRKFRRGFSSVLAITGKAGSGKTILLASLYRKMSEAGVSVLSGEWEGGKSKRDRTLAILAPTNKAALVLRMQGVPATTIHRIIYSPRYDPEFEKVAVWLEEQGEQPNVKGLTSEALARAFSFYKKHQSIPGALIAAGLRGSDFIVGWDRRNKPLDIALVDESSMLDDQQFEDLRELFPTLVLFGDPAQLAPVKNSKGMVFDELPARQKRNLQRIYRQDVDSPILDLAHALSDPELEYDDFHKMVEETARKDDRVAFAERVNVDQLARSPILVWRNATRIRLINAFRTVHDAPESELLVGEPLICDGLELPIKLRHRRIELEMRGLIKGAQAIYMGPSGRPGFSRVHVMGAVEPNTSVSSIVRIEKPDEDEPAMPYAAKMGAVFVHGAALTIHKAQGSQWPVVQVYAPDIRAAHYSGREEAGQQLWKRLAYVAITRAEKQLVWVVNNRLSRPTGQLNVDDLKAIRNELQLMS